MVERDLDQPAEEADPERQTLDPGRQARAEAQLLAVVSHPAQSLDGGDPRAGERAHVHTVANVVLEVFDVHERRLAQVVVRELEVADLGGQHRLRAGRER